MGHGQNHHPCQPNGMAAFILDDVNIAPRLRNLDQGQCAGEHLAISPPYCFTKPYAPCSCDLSLPFLPPMTFEQRGPHLYICKGGSEGSWRTYLRIRAAMIFGSRSCSLRLPTHCSLANVWFRAAWKHKLCSCREPCATCMVPLLCALLKGLLFLEVILVGPCCECNRCRLELPKVEGLQSCKAELAKNGCGSETVLLGGLYPSQCSPGAVFRGGIGHLALPGGIAWLVKKLQRPLPQSAET